MEGGYKLQLKGICKSFPGVKALDNVSLNVRKGTVQDVYKRQLLEIRWSR